MIRTMDFLAPKQGSDLEELWNYWVKKRAPRVAAQPGVHKYTLDRLLKIRGNKDIRGMWGHENLWWDLDMQSFLAVRAALKAVPELEKENQEWYSRFDWHALCILDERVQLDRTVLEPPEFDKGEDGMANGVKSVVYHEPRKGVTKEEVWKYWLETHAPTHYRPNQNLNYRRYVISRITQVLEGDPHGNWGQAEIWWRYTNAEQWLTKSMDGVNKDRLPQPTVPGAPPSKWFGPEGFFHGSFEVAAVFNEKIIVDKTFLP